MHTWTAVWRRRSCKIPYFVEFLKYTKKLRLFHFPKRNEYENGKSYAEPLRGRRVKVHRHHLFSRVSDDYLNLQLTSSTLMFQAPFKEMVVRKIHKKAIIWKRHVFIFLIFVAKLIRGT